MSKPVESIRLFKNSFFEWFTHVHPIVPLVIWSPVVLFLIYRSIFVLDLGATTLAIMAPVGFLGWTLGEYLLHRFVFHFEAKSRIGQRLVYLFHGIHHDQPQDKTRLVMPPLPAVAIAFCLYGVSRLLWGPILVEPFFAFFVVGYLVYDYTHYAVHHFTPRTAIGKFIKQNHMAHHFVEHDRRYGVSSPIWDYVFGTVGRSAQPRSGNTEQTA